MRSGWADSSAKARDKSPSIAWRAAPRGGRRPEFPRCFRTLVVKIKKTIPQFHTRFFEKLVSLDGGTARRWKRPVVKLCSSFLGYSFLALLERSEWIPAFF